MPLVKARLGEVCKYYSIDKGLTAESPGKLRRASEAQMLREQIAVRSFARV
jgi:hypothetical protein